MRVDCVGVRVRWRMYGVGVCVAASTLIPPDTVPSNQRCRSVFNIGGYNSAFLPFFRDFEILGGIFRFCRFFKF